MKVSIITPCYNAEKFISSTIQSIQNQTITDWELILVDDGSTDNTAGIIHQFSIEDSRIKLLQKVNEGTASARKAGLEIATGQFIQFLDADDMLDPDKLRRQVEFMEINELEVSYTDWCHMTLNDKIGPIQGLDCNLLHLLCFWGILGTLPIHSFLYRKSFLASHHINFTTAIKEREDWDFHIQVYSAHPSYARIKGYCGAHYIISPSGKTTGATQEKIQLGTFRYLHYKMNHTSIGYKFLLSLRFSMELCLWNLRKIKYKYISNLLSIKNFNHDYSFYTSLAIGGVLLPISSIIILCTSLIKRIHK